MRKSLFYTFLAVFVATTVVTLAGVAGVLSIDPVILKALVGAFLIELAAAVIAIFRKIDFAEAAAMPYPETSDVALREQVIELRAENEALKAQVSERQDFERRVWLAMNHGSLQSVDDICSILGLQKGNPARERVMAVLGAWLQEGRIERSTPNSSYFRVVPDYKKSK